MNEFEKQIDEKLENLFTEFEKKIDEMDEKERQTAVSHFFEIFDKKISDLRGEKG